MSSDPESVIGRYLQGDETAFRTLVEAQTAVLQARIGRRMAPLLRRRVSVQDVWQEVAIVAFEQRSTFTGKNEQDFNRWLAGIVDRSVLAQINRHAGTGKRALQREVSRAPGDRTLHPESAVPSPSQQAMGAELEQIAASALELLPPDYREVLRLHREDGMSLREIAEKIGRSYDATKKLHGRAMLQFAEHFERLRSQHD